ncbi:MAG: OmpA family protein [Steroidobacteraceae bacterium]
MNVIKLANASGKLGLVALAAIASPLAVAAESGWYVGGNYGESQADIDDRRITEALLASGLTTDSIVDDDSDAGFKLFAGYQFNRTFALEGGYFDLGNFGFVANTTPTGTLNGDTTKIQGLNLDLVASLHFTDRLSAFGRGGVIYAETASSYSATGAITAPASGEKEAEGYKFGLGLQFDFTERFGLRAEAERYRIDDAVGNDGDIDLFSLGFIYRFFGDTPAATTPRTYEAPPPPRVAAPARVVVPVPVKTTEYCSVLDIEFEINRDEIQLEEKERLAVLATFMKKYPETTAVIEGHTDNVGTSADNMRLSQRRADSVVNYLVSDHQIARSRLTAVGYGETRPVGDESTAEGKRANRRINAVIACAEDFVGLAARPARVTMALEMEFSPDNATIKPEYRQSLAQVADYMKANPAVRATVEGHAAEFSGTGSSQVQISPAAAMEVSQRRAQNVVNYMVDELGIARSRLTAEGFGQTRRVSYGTTLEGQQENRRINFILEFPKR